MVIFRAHNSMGYFSQKQHSIYLSPAFCTFTDFTTNVLQQKTKRSALLWDKSWSTTLFLKRFSPNWTQPWCRILVCQTEKDYIGVCECSIVVKPQGIVSSINVSCKLTDQVREVKLQVHLNSLKQLTFSHLLSLLHSDSKELDWWKEAHWPAKLPDYWNAT